tara:strand:- start:358 stop:777 length:420 start_codon:yes stop_codon:yes gene_type:complete
MECAYRNWDCGIGYGYSGVVDGTEGTESMKEWFLDLDSTKKLVARYLREYPHTRDSDTELYFMILKDYYGALPDEVRHASVDGFISDLYLLLKYAPSKSTVSRVRRRVQNDDEIFQGTPEIQERRKEALSQHEKWLLGE